MRKIEHLQLIELCLINYQEATLVTFSTISLTVLKFFQFLQKMFPIPSPFVHFQKGQFVFRGLTNVKLEPNRKEEECKLWKSNWKEIGSKDGCWDVKLRSNWNWKVEKTGVKRLINRGTENWLESDVEKQINLKKKLLNSSTSWSKFQRSRSYQKRKALRFIIHPSSQSTGGLHKEVMCCWSNFQATLPSWWEYMHAHYAHYGT